MHGIVRRSSDNWRANVLAWAEHALFVPKLAMSILLVPVLLVPIVKGDLSPGWSTSFQLVERTIWVAFAAEYFALILIAPDRYGYLRGHPLGLLLVIVPLLRWVRLVGVGRSARVCVDAIYAIAAALRAVLASRGRFKVNVCLCAIVMAAILALSSAAVVLEAERKVEKATIATTADAIWWSVMVITDGDRRELRPVTATGRVTELVLMVTGLGLYGSIIARSVSASIRRHLLDGRGRKEPVKRPWEAREALSVWAKPTTKAVPGGLLTKRNQASDDNDPINDNC